MPDFNTHSSTTSTETTTDTGTAAETSAGTAAETSALIARAIPSGSPGGTVTMDKVADLATLRALRDQAREIRVTLGLPVPDAALRRQTVAVSSGTDPAVDDAYQRFLLDHPEIAKVSVTPQVLTGLVDLSEALASMDEATVPLSWALLAGVLCFDRENARLDDKVLGLLGQHLDTELAPGLTVSQARIMLGGAARVAALQQGLGQSRKGRHQGLRGKVKGQVAQAQDGLAQHQSVRRLKGANKDGVTVPAPNTAK